MKVYIAGPMTGLPKFNVPAFDAAAAVLRKLGYDVVSPAELDSPIMRYATAKSKNGNYADLEKETGETWGEVLARDVRVLSDTGIQGIVLLPDWHKSRGATLEATVGLLNKLKFFHYEEGESNPLAPACNTTIVSEMMEGWEARGTFHS